MADFEKTPQFMSGAAVERFLDEYFGARGWQIEPTTPHEERVLCLGDRKFRRGKRMLHVEYKSGIQTAYTKNVFLETVSVDTAGTPGWVYTCRADYILYAALLNDKILVFLPSKLRDEIEGLKAQFPEVATSKGQNDGYSTHGVIVPLSYAEAHLASKVIDLETAS